MAADSMITPTQLQTPRKTTAWPPCEDLKLPSTFHTVGCYTISRGSCGECYSGDTFHITTWVYIIKDCIALTMDEAKANLNDEQLGFYKKILTQKRKEIKEKIEKEMNLVENH